MNIKIYQIDRNRDENRLMFMSWDWWTSHGFTAPDKELYDLVYEYESNTDNLERIFRIFNHNHPEDYTARSVSVSDIVETPHGLFFCDRIGWQPVKWKKVYSCPGWKCPNCGTVVTLTNKNEIKHYCYKCPECGAISGANEWKERIHAEWVAHRRAYRLYSPTSPQDTIAYVEDMSEIDNCNYDVIIAEDKR